MCVCVCMCKLSRFIAYYSSFNIRHLLTQTPVCAYRGAAWRRGLTNSSRQSSVHFSSSLRLGIARTSSLSESRSVVGRSKSSAREQAVARNKAMREKRRAKVCHVRWKARTMAERLCPPLVIDEIQQGRWLMNVGDEAAVLHRWRGMCVRLSTLVPDAVLTARERLEV